MLQQRLQRKLNPIWLAMLIAPVAHSAEGFYQQTQGIKIDIQSLPSTQVNAFYINRGFNETTLSAYRQACVFSFKIQNVRQDGKSINLDQQQWQWRLLEANQPIQAFSTQAWLEKWNKLGLNKPAQVAFRWAQFPDKQTYAPGDWNQGMIAVPLPAQKQKQNQALQLQMRWTVLGSKQETPHHLNAQPLNCAP